jgi:hypothetical protein
MKLLKAVSLSALSILVSCTAFAADDGQTNITVDFTKSIGKIRPLHGVNNGPVNWGIGPDLANYHKEAGFPSARLHDCHYAGQNVVDVHFIFPIFDADADDPKYYTFAETDAYIAGIINNGTQITYRLGESIECRSRQYSNGGFYVQPPKDFAKWAKICVNIIRHYNDGWADGFHYGVKYWEIWNEPGENISGMWPGTTQQYFELYEAAATAIKKHDPSLKVGGPAACNIAFPIVEPFLAYCRDRKLPLDFFTWHCYAEGPQTIALNSVTARKLLDQYGFTNAESHVTEWHPMWYAWENAVDANELGNPNPGKYAAMREKFDAMRGPKAASFAASALIMLQDVPLDMANYYTADTNPWGMFDGFGVPGRVYYAFVAFNQLTKTPNRVSCDSQGAPETSPQICAGLSDDHNSATIVICNFEAPPRKLTLHLKNLPLAKPLEAETFIVDASRELASIGKTTLTQEPCDLAMDLPTNSVNLVRLTTCTSN